MAYTIIDNLIFITPEQFRQKFPEFVNVADNTIMQLFIEAKELYMSDVVNARQFTNQQRAVGIYYATAHLLQLDMDKQADSSESGGGGGDGGLIHKVLDNINDNDLMSTDYGKTLYRILGNANLL
jgi:hypothetical protein